MFRFDERMIRNAGTNICIEAEHLAHRYIEAFETSALWSGNRGLQENFCPAERIPRGRFDTRAEPLEKNLFANIDGFDVQRGARCFQDMKSRVHDLRPNAVAVRDCDRYSLHLESASFGFSRL